MCQVQKLASNNRRISAASIALEVAEVKGQLDSAQTIRHTLQQVSLHDRCSRRKPLQKLAHKKACKQFVEDDLAKSMNYWNRVLWSDESKVNLFGSDGVQHVWWCPGEEYQENCALLTVDLGGGSIMVWGCMSAAGTGELRFIEGNMDSNTYWDCDDALPSETVFQHNHPKHTAKMTLPCWWSWRWRSGQVCLQTWTLMIILKQKMEKHHVSNNRYVSVEEWKRTPATACAALVNSMPSRINAVLDNNGAPTKYWHFGHSFDVFT